MIWDDVTGIVMFWRFWAITLAPLMKCRRTRRTRERGFAMPDSGTLGVTGYYYPAFRNTSFELNALLHSRLAPRGQLHHGISRVTFNHLTPPDFRWNINKHSSPHHHTQTSREYLCCKCVKGLRRPFERPRMKGKTSKIIWFTFGFWGFLYPMCRSADTGLKSFMRSPRLPASLLQLGKMYFVPSDMVTQLEQVRIERQRP